MIKIAVIEDGVKQTYKIDDAMDDIITQYRDFWNVAKGTNFETNAELIMAILSRSFKHMFNDLHIQPIESNQVTLLKIQLKQAQEADVLFTQVQE